MPYPSRFIVLLALIPTTLSLLCVILPWHNVVLAIDGAFIAVFAIDALVGRRRVNDVSVEIHTAKTWSLERSEEIKLDIRSTYKGELTTKVGIDLDDVFVIEKPSFTLKFPKAGRVEYKWKSHATKRGQYKIHAIHLACKSPFGLWFIRKEHIIDRQVQVYPNLRQVNEYEMLARTNRLSLIGIRTARRTGGETEFERLREHMPNDSITSIDWKATARRNEIIVRDYSISQSQNMILMVDAGRMMTGSSNSKELTLLDHAIDAALMLAHVAQRQGDRVGLIVYHQNICRFIPPDGGARQVNRIIHALHDVHAMHVESRHDLAYMYLSRHCKKRSLLIHMTHVLDQVNIDQLSLHLSILSKRHLPLTVLLRDPDCYSPLAQEPTTEKNYYKAAAAASILNWRNEAIERLKKQGVLTLDCFAEQLTGKLITQYLNIKARHLL